MNKYLITYSVKNGIHNKYENLDTIVPGDYILNVLQKFINDNWNKTIVVISISQLPIEEYNPFNK